MSLQRKLNRSGPEQQRVQIRPIPVEGTRLLAKREGGAHDLPVIETAEGVFLSCWMINDKAKKLLRENKAVLTLVVDTNVPGHPTVSMVMQQIDLIPDMPEGRS